MDSNLETEYMDRLLQLCCNGNFEKAAEIILVEVVSKKDSVILAMKVAYCIKMENVRMLFAALKNVKE